MLENLRYGVAACASLWVVSAAFAESAPSFPQVKSAKPGTFSTLASPEAPKAGNAKPARPADTDGSIPKAWKAVSVPVPPPVDPIMRLVIESSPIEQPPQTAQTNDPARPISVAAVEPDRLSAQSARWTLVNVPLPPPVDPRLRAPAEASLTTTPAPAEPHPTDAMPEDAGLPKGWKAVSTPTPPRLDKSLRALAAKADRDKLKAAELAKIDTGKSEAAKSEAARSEAAQPAPSAPDAPRAEAVPAAAAPATAAQPATRKGAKASSLAKVAPAAEPVAPTAAGTSGIFSLFDKQLAAASQADQDSSRMVLPESASAFAPSPAARQPTRTASLGILSPLRQRGRDTDTRDDDLDDEGGGASLEKQVASVQTACLKPQLVAMIKKAGEHFGGTPVITSGYRSHGRRGSLHRRCEAADFQIPGISSAQIVAFLRKLPGAGGVGTYCHTKSVHLDTGTPRDWHQCAFHRRFALRAPVLAASQ